MVPVAKVYFEIFVAVLQKARTHQYSLDPYCSFFSGRAFDIAELSTSYLIRKVERFVRLSNLIFSICLRLSILIILETNLFKNVHCCLSFSLVPSRTVSNMPMSRFEPSSIKNKIKREEVAQKSKKAKNQLKLQKRLARAKVEANDPTAKRVRLFSICEILIETYFQKRLEENVPRTLDNMREFDPSVSTPNVDGEPSNESQQLIDLETDLSNDPFASYFDSVDDPTIPPKILITTSPKASKSTYDFCDELVGVFPGAEFIRRKKGKGFEVGRIAGWAADRGYKHLCVVNEDMKKPSQ